MERYLDGLLFADQNAIPSSDKNKNRIDLQFKFQKQFQAIVTCEYFN